jgi:RimJ/RimL family protein N-acetyltransferase
MTTIETERLILRAPVLDDFEELARVGADPEVMRYLTVDGKPLSRFNAWQSFASIAGHWALRGYGMFMVRERGTGAFVGRVGPWFPEGWPDLEVGWTLGREMWGRGYASEAARACLDFVFDGLNRPYVCSLITPENVRSIRVAERLGERLEQETTLPHLPPDRKVLRYGISAAEWRSFGGKGLR